MSSSRVGTLGAVLGVWGLLGLGAGEWLSSEDRAALRLREEHPVDHRGRCGEEGVLELDGGHGHWDQRGQEGERKPEN